MKILLTGAAGYLGSHLAGALVADGHDVVVLKRQTSKLHRLAGIEQQLYFYDVENLDLAKPFQDQGPIDAVVHTATCYGRAGESASEVFEVNTAFPLRLLEMATFFNTDTILYSYLNAYSLSKKQFSEWGKQLSTDNKIRFLNIRLEYMYGPGDDASKFKTWIIEQCLANVSEIKLTAGEQRRDFIYIDDVVAGYRTLVSKAECLGQGYQEIGLGSGHAGTVREFVETVHRLSKSKVQLKFGALPYRQNEIMNSQANTQQLEMLGWRCVTDLDDRVRSMVKSGRTQPRLSATVDAEGLGS